MTSYQNVFGGNIVYPAEVSYRSFTLSADTTLAWPTELATDVDVVSQIMDVTPSGVGFSVIMPPADQVSVGETTLIFNVGATSFTVKDNAGNVIASIASGLAWQIYLTSNSTAAGTWRAVQYAAGTSTAQAAALAGFGVKALANTLAQSTPVGSFNSDYTLNTSDRAQVRAWTGGAGTFTLSSSTTLGNDWFCYIRNNGTGALTVTAPGGESVDGGSSVIYNPGDSSLIICDGSNFFTIGYGRAPEFIFDYVAISLTGQTSPYVLSGAELNRITYNFSGTLTANMEVIVPDTIQQYWIANTTTGAYTLTVKTASGSGIAIASGARTILYCDGVDVYPAESGGLSFPIAVSQGGTGATTASAARANLGATSIGSSLFTAGSANDVWSALGTTPVAAGGTGTSTVPTDGQLLIGDGTGYVPANLTAGTGISITNGSGSVSISSTTASRYELIATSVASASTYVDFTGLSSDYSEYIIVSSGLYGNGAQILMYTSSNNGVSFDSGASNYISTNIECTSVGVAGSSSSGTSMFIGYLRSSTYGNYVSIRMVNSGIARPFAVDATSGSYQTSGTQNRVMGFRASTTAVNAIRLTAGTNNLYGTFRLYGIKAT